MRIKYASYNDKLVSNSKEDNIMTIHEQYREVMEDMGKAVGDLKDGSEEQKRVLDGYSDMYKLMLEHEKIDEEINDRRYKIDKDSETDNAKIKHDTKMKIIGCASLFLAFISGLVAENYGLIKPKVQDFIRRT